MKKSKGIVVLLLTLILTVFFCFTAAVGIGPTGTGAAKHINTGLDLAGGVSITYQAKESNPTSEEMSDTIYKLQKRVEQYSTEAQVYQEGSDRITVEIPGVTDADTILNDLGKPGSLYFITKEDADGNQNFTTGQDGYVLSRTMDEIKESGSVVLEGSDVADAQGGAIQEICDLSNTASIFQHIGIYLKISQSFTVLCHNLLCTVRFILFYRILSYQKLFVQVNHLLW